MHVYTFVRSNSIACRHDNNNLLGMQITSDSREIVTAQLSWMHKYIIAGKLHARINVLRYIAGLFNTYFVLASLLQPPANLRVPQCCICQI